MGVVVGVDLRRVVGQMPANECELIDARHGVVDDRMLGFCLMLGSDCTSIFCTDSLLFIQNLEHRNYIFHDKIYLFKYCELLLNC